jgi:hypothetical protein
MEDISKIFLPHSRQQATLLCNFLSPFTSTEAFAVCYDPPNSHTNQSTNVVPGVATTCLRHRRRRPHAHIHRPEWRCCTDSGYHCSVLFRISKRVVRTRPSVFVPVMFTLTTRSTPQPPLLCCIRRSPPGSNLERIGPCARVCVCVCLLACLLEATVPEEAPECTISFVHRCFFSAAFRKRGDQPVSADESRVVD